MSFFWVKAVGLIDKVTFPFPPLPLNLYSLGLVVGLPLELLEGPWIQKEKSLLFT